PSCSTICCAGSGYGGSFSFSYGGQSLSGFGTCTICSYYGAPTVCRGGLYNSNPSYFYFNGPSDCSGSSHLLGSCPSG
ncbi:unnamed protein product, partial [Adineta steineri]